MNSHSARLPDVSIPTARTGAFALAALILIAALAPQLHAQDSPSAAPGNDKKVDKEFYTPKDRQAAMHAASLFVPRAVADADIMLGPKQSKKLFTLHFNDKVICDFVEPGVKMGGKTSKFSCKITSVEGSNGKVQTLTPDFDEEPVKVKFGANDNEVYAEIVATRLMWALGYYADAWFPVRVECHNCPANPESGSGPSGTKMFDPATIVRKLDGHKMYEVGKSEEGWSWKELDEFNGRPTYERDALKLLGAFMKHSDNKPPQQRLVCDSVKVDQGTTPFTTTCKDSKMLIQDVGATFGGGGLFTSNTGAKVNLKVWSADKLWKKVGKPGTPEAACPVCQAAVTKSLTAKDGLDNPTISEEGRRFLSGLMCQLSDAQIENLFAAARVAAMPEWHNKDGSFKQGQDQATIVKKWVQAFKEKREELVSGRCRWKTKPADEATIDNPMGLPTVPNFCTAKSF